MLSGFLRLEGGPKSFLESVSSMVPVISTPVGQVNDLYENNPLLGKTFNPEEYSIILEFLIENYNKYSLSIRKEYSRLSSLYSFKNQSKIWEYKFIELLLDKYYEKIFISICHTKIQKGGGANFLSSLENYLKNKNKINTNFYLSGSYFINSFPFNSPLGFFLILLKAKTFNNILIYRVDGPISIYRINPNDLILDGL